MKEKTDEQDEDFAKIITNIKKQLEENEREMRINQRALIHKTVNSILAVQELLGWEDDVCWFLKKSDKYRNRCIKNRRN